MANELREIFATVTLKAAKGLAQLRKFNDTLDGTEKELDGTEKKATSLGKELNRLGGHAKNAGGAIAKGIGIATGAIVAVTTAVVGFAAAWAEGADEVGKQASKLNVSAQALQELRFAAELSGAEADNLKDVLKDLQINTADALKESGPLAEVIKALGLNIDEVARMDVIERFEFLSDELNKIADDSTRSALTVKAFGSAGLEMGDLIKQGSVGIRAGREELRKWGLVLTDEELAKAAEFNDTISRGRAISKAFASLMASRVVPIVTKYIRRLNDLLRQNRDLIAQRVEQLFEKLAMFIERAVPALTTLAEQSLELVSALGGVDGTLRTAAEGWAIFKLAGLATLGPAGAITAAIGATIIGLARIDRELRKAKREAIELDQRLRNPESATSGLDRSELEKTAEGRALLEAEDKSQAAAAVLRETTQTRAALLQAEENRRNVTADEFAGAMGEVEQESTKAQIEAAEKRLAEAQALAQKHHDEAQRAREAYDEKLSEANRIAESEARDFDRMLDQVGRITGSVSLDEIRRNMNADGAGKGKSPKKLTVMDQLKAAFGGEAPTAPGPLNPSSLGTTINNVDARVFIDVGGVQQEFSLPPGASPRDIAQQAAQITVSEIRKPLEEGYRQQRSVLIG